MPPTFSIVAAVAVVNLVKDTANGDSSLLDTQRTDAPERCPAQTSPSEAAPAWPGSFPAASIVQQSRDSSSTQQVSGAIETAQPM